MSLNCGIVGLPNVGKSTLFNALTATQNAQAANYPFCTIDPNKGIVDVPDVRLHLLAKINNSEKVIPTKLEFVDIAGLVKGASKGEGLGNKFLANIREVDAIIHVLRCFDDNDVIHVNNDVNPVNDAEVVDTELLIADIESLEKRFANLAKKFKNKDQEAIEQTELIEKILPYLQQGIAIRDIVLTDDEHQLAKQFGLLTLKPMLYVCNVHENDVITGNNYVAQVKSFAKDHNSDCIIISAAIEQEIATLDDQASKDEFIRDLGLSHTGLDQIIQYAFKILNLSTFFTSGPKETRAWTIKKDANAVNAAGQIHSDLSRGFICAEVISYDDYIAHQGYQGAKDAGKLRQEGKAYIVVDGDVLLIRFNV